MMQEIKSKDNPEKTKDELKSLTTSFIWGNVSGSCPIPA